MRRPLASLLACLLLVSLASPPARAQVALEDDDRRSIGREIARIAIIDYRNLTEQTPRDAAIAASLLEVAQTYATNEPILLRYLVEAYRSAGDDEGVISATRRLAAADPGDEVAQLRLISWIISRRQTAEQRIAAYSEWLDGSRAELLRDKPAIRSRLALDAALLHRELGDQPGFIQRLTQATSLDSSNKEAASLAAAAFSQSREDPIAELELAINVLLADPVDPNVHIKIAELLAALGRLRPGAAVSTRTQQGCSSSRAATPKRRA